MNRRLNPGASVAGVAIGGVASSAASARGGAGPATFQMAGELNQSLGQPVQVAFLIGEDANMMDTAGPWEVFQDARVESRELFRLFTVAPAREMLALSGGLQVTPHYSVAEAPQPDVIVVPAQRSTEAARSWLRQASQGARVTMSVCTGAFHLAAAGLLDGLAATTHHLFLDAFEKAYPGVELRRDARFVDCGRVATAGGLTAGIDLALHIVRRLHGHEVASSTARYLEYDGRAWQGRLP